MFKWGLNPKPNQPTRRKNTLTNQPGANRVKKKQQQFSGQSCIVDEFDVGCDGVLPDGTGLPAHGLKRSSVLVWYYSK